MDFAELEHLGYAERVQWLKFRFELVFRRPFAELLKLEGGCYVWLCAVNLLCSAIEALSSFEFRGSDRDAFVGFVEKYFSAPFRSASLVLHDPKPRRNPASTPAEHLYKYFRCGLAHSFCIEWGGLRHREDGAPDYLFEVLSGIAPEEKSLGVVPRELVQDFLQATESFFAALESRLDGCQEALLFQDRFNDVFLNKTRWPVP